MSPVAGSAVVERRAMPALHIRMLGEFGVVYGEQVLQGVSASRLQSLLARLVLQRNAPQSRRHLAFTLWPDSTESQARTNLRRELHGLRQALPAADRFLAVEMQTIQWRADAPFTLDVAEFEGAVAAARGAGEAGDEAGAREALVRALALYKGDLLPGCYDEWLLAERERLRQAYLQALEQLILYLKEQGDVRAATGYAHQLLREDPLAEEAYLLLMRLYVASRDRARALRVYHSCVSTLQREMGVAPGAETRQAYETLLQAESLPAPAQAGTPPSIAPMHPVPVGASPLVGRQAAWQRLQACWHEAQSGRSLLAAVVGEAGIGKTRLLEELVDWAARQGVMTAETRCYASEGGLAYAPVIDWLRAPALRGGLLRLEGVWLSQVARLLPELLAERPDLQAPEPIAAGWQRQHFFEALARAVLRAGRPLLLVVDDLQWTDQETLAWLHYLLRSRPQAPLLLAAAIRSTEIEPGHPLAAWLAGLRGNELLREVALGPLDAADTALLGAHVAGAALSAERAAQLYAETEGQPLFIVETVRAGALQDGAAQAGSLSPKIQAVIAARLARLSPAARRLANLAAAIGRAFAFDVLAEASEEDEDGLVQALDELWQQHIIREQGDNAYDFSHNKIREVVYNSLSAANRRLLHRRIAGAMETVRAADLDNSSKQIAHQFALAGVTQKAVAYYARAGRVAQGIFANAEAIRLYSSALALLQTLPESRERAQQELSVQRRLAIAHRNSKGYAAGETGQALGRARVLSRELGVVEAMGPILWGLFSFNFVRGDLDQAHKLGQELLALAQEQDDAAFRQQAYHALGGTLCSLGAYAPSLSHFEQGMALYDAQQHRAQVASCGVDLGVFSQAWSTHAMWHLGQLDRARQQSVAAVQVAEGLGHPFSQALAMAYATMLYQFSCDSRQVVAWAQRTIALCTEKGIGYYDSWVRMLQGWALAQQGAVVEGIEGMERGLSDFRASSSGARLPYYLTLLAQAYGIGGRVQEAGAKLEEALALGEMNQEAWYSAETQRLMGELALQAGDAAGAEACYQKSLATGRRQEAPIFELRATVSLARLWLAQKREAEASEALAAVCGGFREGWDTVDLQVARTLLAQLP